MTLDEKIAEAERECRTLPTTWVRLYLSGPVDVAKQVIRAECWREGLCVTIEPTTYIYTGGEESGYVVGLIDYPRFPSSADAIVARAIQIAERLMVETHQRSCLVMTATETTWIRRAAS